MAWRPSAARWPNCRWSSGAEPTRLAAMVTGGGRQRRLRPLPRRRPSLLLRLVRPCPREVPPLRRRWVLPLAPPCPRAAPLRLLQPLLRAWRLGAVPLRVVRPGPPRPAAVGRPAAFRCRRSRRLTPGCKAARRCSSPSWCPIARCRARLGARRSARSQLAPPPSWRRVRPVAPRRPPRPSAPSGRRRPAPLLPRIPLQPPVRLRAFPPRPRASRRCSRLTARLPAPAPVTHASGLDGETVTRKVWSGARARHAR